MKPITFINKDVQKEVEADLLLHICWRLKYGQYLVSSTYNKSLGVITNDPDHSPENFEVIQLKELKEQIESIRKDIRKT